MRTVFALCFLVASMLTHPASGGEVASAETDPSPAFKDRGRAAVLMSSARSKGAAAEFEYTMEAWDTDEARGSTGVVTVKGLPGMDGGDLGDIRWRLSGTTIRGYIVKGDSNVATFSGEIGQSEARGTVKTAVGQEGTWVWVGPLPKLVEAAADQVDTPSAAAR